MIRVSRVGRKEQMKRIVYQHYKRNEGESIKIAKVVHRMGMVMSTDLKRMARELAQECENILLIESPSGLTLAWLPMMQLPLPDRYVTINGKQHKIANWVDDAREYQHV